MSYPALTVKELRNYCDSLIKEGHEDKKILITSDDEGNAYHGLCFAFTSDQKSIKEVYDAGMFNDCHVVPEEVVLLG